MEKVDKKAIEKRGLLWVVWPKQSLVCTNRDKNATSPPVCQYPHVGIYFF
jgi:hypothetical protein